ncbi:MAG TPA: hypothetical protein VK508_07800 [Cyclobacteriaceae bacterium]|nr:hypothetical protein [Cyclobacteriaceae bacterium]
MGEAKSMIKNLSLVFIVLASLFAFSPEVVQVHRKVTTIEVVLQQYCEEKLLAAFSPFPAPQHLTSEPESVSQTLPGVRSRQKYLVACLQHHSSLSC